MKVVDTIDSSACENEITTVSVSASVIDDVASPAFSSDPRGAIAHTRPNANGLRETRKCAYRRIARPRALCRIGKRSDSGDVFVITTTFVESDG